MLAIWTACALLVAGGLAVPRPRGVGVVAAGVLCAMGVTTAVGVAFDRNLERPDWRVVARALGTLRRRGGRAILVQHYRDLLPLSLYVPGLSSGGGRSPVRVREFDVVSFTSPASAGFCWWGVGLQPVAVADADVATRSRGFRPVSAPARTPVHRSCAWWRRTGPADPGGGVAGAHRDAPRQRRADLQSSAAVSASTSPAVSLRHRPRGSRPSSSGPKRRARAACTGARRPRTCA